MGACEDLRVLQMQTKVVLNSILRSAPNSREAANI